MSRIQKPRSGKCEVNTRVSERASERRWIGTMVTTAITMIFLFVYTFVLYKYYYLNQIQTRAEDETGGS